jgi:hypothetical protein
LAVYLSVIDSSVSTATGYGLDGQGPIPGRDKIYLFSTTPIPTLGPTQPPSQWVLVLFHWGKVAGA